MATAAFYMLAVMFTAVIFFGLYEIGVFERKHKH
jgi:hypothetical protein